MEQQMLIGKKITRDVLYSHIYKFSRSLLIHWEVYTKIIGTEVEKFKKFYPYICPLCLTNFIMINTDDMYLNAVFSLDHVPPESVGGSYKILTCKTCNNNAGHYEAEFGNLINLEALADKDPDTVINAAVELKESKTIFKAKLKIGENGSPSFFFNEQAKKYDPKLKAFVEELHNNSYEGFSLLIPGYDKNKLEKAYLKSAYLICFLNWGYEFVFSKNGELIRKVLNGEIPYPIETPVFFIDSKKLELPAGVGIISEPEAVQAYYVNLQIKIGRSTKWVTIFIPDPTPSGWENLKSACKFMAEQKPGHFSYYSLPQSMPDRFRGYTGDWDDFKSGRQTQLI